MFVVYMLSVYVVCIYFRKIPQLKILVMHYVEERVTFEF